MADTVDQILTEGDAMYVKAFDDGTADPAKLNQLPTARPANAKIKIELLLSDCLRKNLNNGI